MTSSLIALADRSVELAAFQPGGRLLATAARVGNDCAVTWWDTAALDELRTVRVGSSAVTQLVFDPRGEQLLVVCDEVVMMSATTGLVTRRLGKANRAAWSPDGTVIAAAEWSRPIEIRAIESGAMIRWIELGFGEDAKQLAFSSDGAELVAEVSGFGIDAPHQLRRWSIATGRLLDSRPCPPLLALGSFAAFARRAELVRLELTDGSERVLGALPGPIAAVALDAAGTAVAAIDDVFGKPSTVAVWWADAGTAVFTQQARRLAIDGPSRRIAVCEPGVVIAGEPPVRARARGTPTAPAPLLGPDRRWLVLGEHLLDLRTPELGRPVPVSGPHAFSADGRWLAGERESFVALAELDGDRSVWLAPFTRAARDLAVSRDGGVVFALSRDELVRWRPEAAAVEVIAKMPKRSWWRFWDRQSSLRFDPGGRHLLVDDLHSYRVFDTEGRLVCKFEADAHEGAAIWAGEGELATLARVDEQLVLIQRSLATPDHPRVMPLLNSGRAGTLRVLPDGRLVATGYRNERVLLIDPGRAAVRELSGALIAVDPVTGALWIRDTPATIQRWVGDAGDRLAAPDDLGELVAASSRWVLDRGHDALRLRHAATLALAATIVLRGRDYVVTTPSGLFDGTPRGWHGVQFRFGDELRAVASLDQYFADFFAPGVLAAVWRGDPVAAPAELAARDRRTPRLELSASAVSDREVAIELRVTESPPDAAHPGGSGARDVRLYRDDLLVHAWRGDVLGGAPSVVLTTRVQSTGRASRFTAYAFNQDNVKSADFELAGVKPEVAGRATRPAGRPMSPSRTPPVRLWLVAIGVDRHAEVQSNLMFAVADARAYASVLEQSIARIGARLVTSEPVVELTEVVTATLLDGEATRTNILAGLARLAGVEMAPPGPAASLGRSSPDDVVVMTFSGHGQRDGERFLLIPHDYRPGEPGTAISDRDLETAFAAIDARCIVLIIDSCHAGAVLTSDDDRRGSLNARGLAQLAYEKGMFVLSAAQASQTARESPMFGQGLLSYALLRDGLERGLSDHDVADGIIRLGEWLRFAAQRVPELHAQMFRERDLKAGQPPALCAQIPQLYMPLHVASGDLMIGRRRYEFLSEAWWRAVDQIAAIERALERTPPPAVAINVDIASPAGVIRLIATNGVLARGHRDDAPATLTMSVAIARKVFIERDLAPAVKAFVDGDLAIHGDPSALVTMQMAQPTPLVGRIIAITL